MRTRKRSGAQTLSQTVYDDLLERIRSGEIRVGARIPTQQELMKAYGVGHSVVRDAMQQLSAMGIVDVRPRRGAVVLSVDSTRALDDHLLAVLLDEQAVDEIFALRRLIAVEVAGLAAEIGTEAQVQKIVEAHDRFGKALAAGLPLLDYDVAFHRVITEAASSTVYLRMYEVLSNLMSLVRTHAIDLPGGAENVAREHQAIVDAIVARSPAKARGAMAAHVDTATALSRTARQ
jgi:GntR family transcriptional repressor for pyruvate dehydrogenase complex